MELDVIITALQTKVDPVVLRHILMNNFDSEIHLTQKLVISIKGNRARSNFRVTIPREGKSPFRVTVLASQVGL